MSVGQHIALFRGLNVGRAKRVAMVDLRKLMCDLGYVDVRTVLNSGNVIFGVALAEPNRVESGRVEPGRTEPGRAEPGRAEPGLAEPGRANPGWTELDHAARIEEALVFKLGVAARVTVLNAQRFDQIVGQNCLIGRATDPSRLLVSVLRDAADRPRLEPLLRTDWSPEALAAGAWATYAWCPGGVLASRALAALDVLLGDAVTSRNWSTMLKLHALLTERTVPAMAG